MLIILDLYTNRWYYVRYRVGTIRIYACGVTRTRKQEILLVMIEARDFSHGRFTNLIMLKICFVTSVNLISSYLLYRQLAYYL